MEACWYSPRCGRPDSLMCFLLEAAPAEDGRFTLRSVHTGSTLGSTAISPCSWPHWFPFILQIPRFWQSLPFSLQLNNIFYSTSLWNGLSQVIVTSESSGNFPSHSVPFLMLTWEAGATRMNYWALHCKQQSIRYLGIAPDSIISFPLLLLSSYWQGHHCGHFHPRAGSSGRVSHLVSLSSSPLWSFYAHGKARTQMPECLLPLLLTFPFHGPLWPEGAGFHCS